MRSIARRLSTVMLVAMASALLPAAEDAGVAPGDFDRVLAGPGAPVILVGVDGEAGLVFSAHEDGQVRAGPLDDDQAAYVITGPAGGLEAMEVAQGHGWFALGGGDGVIEVRDSATGALRWSETGHEGAVGALVASPSGERLFSGGADGSIAVWTVETATLQRRLSGHAGPVHDLAVDPTESWIVSGSEDRTLRIWDLESGQANRIVDWFQRPVTRVAVAPDGTWYLAEQNQTVKIWDAEHHRLRHRQWFSSHQLPPTAALTPDGQLRILLARGGVYLVSLRSYGESGPRFADLSGRGDPAAAEADVRDVAVSSNGRWLIAGFEDGSVRSADLPAIIAAIHAPEAVVEVRPPVAAWADADQSEMVVGGNGGRVSEMVLSGDGRWLALKVRDHRVRILRTEDWSLLASIDTVVRRGGGSMAAAPDGSWLATYGEDRAVVFWNPEDGRRLGSVDESRNLPAIIGGGGDPDWMLIGGGYLPSGGSCMARRISVPEGEVLQHLAFDGEGHSYATWFAAPVSGRVVCATNMKHRAIVWPVADGRVTEPTVQVRAEKTSRGSLEIINTIAVDTAGEWLLAYAKHGQVYRLDPGSGEVLAAIEAPDNLHNHPILACSPDGSWLVVGDDRSEHLVFLHASSGEVLGELAGHATEISGIAVAPDGSWIVSSSTDGAVRVWDRPAFLDGVEAVGSEAGDLPESEDP